MHHAQQSQGVSERRACRVLGQVRSTQQYRPKAPGDETPLVKRMTELATQYGRYGYRRITALMGDDILDEWTGMCYFFSMNSKRPDFPTICERSDTTRSTSFITRFPNNRSIISWSVSSFFDRRFFFGV